MRSLALSLFAIPSACAAASGPLEPMPEHHTLMIVAGADSSLSAFERAARDCGLDGISRVPDGQGGTLVRVRGPIPNGLAGYSCAKNWVSQRSAELRLLPETEAEHFWD